MLCQVLFNWAVTGMVVVHKYIQHLIYANLYETSTTDHKYIASLDPANSVHDSLPRRKPNSGSKVAIPIIGPTMIVQSIMAIVLLQWQEDNYAKDGRFVHFHIFSDSAKKEESQALNLIGIVCLFWMVVISVSAQLFQNAMRSQNEISHIRCDDLTNLGFCRYWVISSDVQNACVSMWCAHRLYFNVLAIASSSSLHTSCFSNVALKHGVSLQTSTLNVIT